MSCARCATGTLVTGKSSDAFGRALADYRAGKTTHYIVERDDGYIDPSSLAIYFSEFKDWPELEKRMLDYVKGDVIDIGCGAGRHTLELEKRGAKVFAIDRSPLAIKVAAERGAKNAAVCSLEELMERSLTNPGFSPSFGTVVLAGHNVGLLHDERRGKEILRWLACITAADAKIVGTTRDPRATESPEHIAYQTQNVQEGKMPGELRLRIRYRQFVGDWFDYLFLSPAELRMIVHGTGWRVEECTPGDAGFGAKSGSYLAILGKDAIRRTGALHAIGW